MTKKTTNQWSQEMLEVERTFFADNEVEMVGARNEAALVAHYPRLVCDCGAEADFHSGIGAYKCFGRPYHLLVKGEWA